MIRVISQRILSKTAKTREAVKKPAAQEQKPTPKKPADSATKKPIPKDKIFVRPKGVPKEWVKRPSRNGKGIKYVDPKNPHTYVRIQKGNPKSSNPGQQKNYISWQKNGRPLDKNGKIISRDMQEAHIPLEDFKFKLELFQ